MATQTMKTDGAQNYHSETVLSGQTSDPVMIPDVPNHRHIAFFVSPTASANVMVTISPRKDVENDTANVHWQEWSPSTVSADTNDGSEYPLTAAKLIATGGDAFWEIRA